jgi:hypothetical protein
MTFVTCNVLFSWVCSYANVIANIGCYTDVPSVRLKKLMLNLCFQSIQKLKRDICFVAYFYVSSCKTVEDLKSFE